MLNQILVHHFGPHPGRSMNSNDICLSHFYRTIIKVIITEMIFFSIDERVIFLFMTQSHIILTNVPLNKNCISL